MGDSVPRYYLGREFWEQTQVDPGWDGQQKQRLCHNGIDGENPMKMLWTPATQRINNPREKISLRATDGASTPTPVLSRSSLACWMMLLQCRNSFLWDGFIAKKQKRRCHMQFNSAICAFFVFGKGSWLGNTTRPVIWLTAGWLKGRRQWKGGKGH
jgi:hypothetical protein